MLDEPAIQLIQQTAIDAEASRNTRLPSDTVALPNNYTIHDLERFLDGRRRYRGSLETASLSDFVAYVRANSGDNQGFIDADKLRATVLFNLGTVDEPGHGDWTATLGLKATAAFRALGAVQGKQLDQRDLIEWLEDWSFNVVGFDGEAGFIHTSAAIEAIRKINIKSRKDSTHVHEDHRASRSAMEEVEASAGPSLPNRITFRCEPYLGLPEREFKLRLSVLTSHDEPLLVVRAMGYEEHLEAIAQDFKRALIEEVGDAATLTIGTFKP